MHFAYLFCMSALLRLVCALVTLASLPEIWVYPTPLDGAAKHT